MAAAYSASGDAWEAKSTTTSLKTASAPRQLEKRTLFVGSETTGQRAAIIYTMVECAKRHGQNPEAWLTDVLERLPAMTNQDDLSVLLPSNWQPATAANQPLRETCPA